MPCWRQLQLRSAHPDALHARRGGERSQQQQLVNKTLQQPCTTAADQARARCIVKGSYQQRVRCIQHQRPSPMHSSWPFCCLLLLSLLLLLLLFSCSGLGDKLRGYKDIKDFVASLEKPRWGCCAVQYRAVLCCAVPCCALGCVRGKEARRLRTLCALLPCGASWDPGCQHALSLSQQADTVQRSPHMCNARTYTAQNSLATQPSTQQSSLCAVLCCAALAWVVSMVCPGVCCLMWSGCVFLCIPPSLPAAAPVSLPACAGV